MSARIERTYMARVVDGHHGEVSKIEISRDEILYDVMERVCKGLNKASIRSIDDIRMLILLFEWGGRGGQEEVVWRLHPKKGPVVSLPNNIPFCIRAAKVFDVNVKKRYQSAPLETLKKIKLSDPEISQISVLFRQDILDLDEPD